MKKKFNISILIGRAGSKGFPGKNTIKILGRPCCDYPIIASKNSKKIDKFFVLTDCSKIKKSLKKFNPIFIERPKYLNSDKALGDDVFKFAYDEIIKKYINKNQIKYIVLLFANAPTITSTMIRKGISILDKNKDFDSVVSTSVYNMWSPLRARKLTKKGNLVPFVKFEYFGDPKTLNCDRDSQGNVYYADMSISIVRPRCLDNIKNGLLPQRWMGKKIAPLYSWGACDIDYKWQVPGVEYWLKENGYKNKNQYI